MRHPACPARASSHCNVLSKAITGTMPRRLHRCVRPGPLCLGLVAPVSSPGGLRGAIYKTCACPRMRGTPRPVLSEHQWSLTSAPWWSVSAGVFALLQRAVAPCGERTTSSYL